MAEVIENISKSDIAAIREYNPETDKNFVYSTFLKGMFYGDNYYYRMTPKDLFMNYYHNILDDIVSNSHIKIACLKDEPDAIIAYAIISHNDTVLHFCFSKKEWRKIGLQKDLIPNTVHTVTHLTDLGRSILKNHKGLIFNPFIPMELE